MANAQAFLNISMDYWKRNNPIERGAMAIVQGLYTLITFKSRWKLLKYHLLLAEEKMNRMEQVLDTTNPYEVGHKINKIR